jgi:hypothetical protein
MIYKLLGWTRVTWLQYWVNFVVEKLAVLYRLPAYPFSTASILAAGPTQRSIQWVPEGKRPKRFVSFFTIKPTRCTNFTNLFCHETLHVFGQFLCPSSGVYSLYAQQCYMSYRFVDSFQAGAYHTATSPNSPRRRILTDYFNNYNFS